MEPDAAFVSLRESWAVTWLKNAKDQRRKKAKTWWNWNMYCQPPTPCPKQCEGTVLAAFIRFTPKCGHRGRWFRRLVQIWTEPWGLPGAHPLAGGSPPRHLWLWSGDDLFSFTPCINAENYHKGAVHTPLMVKNRTAFSHMSAAVSVGKYTVRTSIIQSKLWTKDVPKLWCCPHTVCLKVKAKSAFKHFYECFCPKTWLCGSISKKYNIKKYIDYSHWQLWDICIIFNSYISNSKLPLATYFLMIRQKNIYYLQHAQKSARTAKRSSCSCSDQIKTQIYAEFPNWCCGCENNSQHS